VCCVLWFYDLLIMPDSYLHSNVYGIDSSHLEAYLSDAEFEAVFKSKAIDFKSHVLTQPPLVTKQQFYAKSQSKRAKLLKEADLY
jgi:hypothetical protein